MEIELVSHMQVSQLFHNKFIVVLGDSIQRSVYKDLVLLLQKEKYLDFNQLKSKGEMSFEHDCLVEGGTLGTMQNGRNYREVRQYRSAHHLVRFYFVTRVYSRYMKSVLEDFRHGLKPDLVIVNSCVWDISRYNPDWNNQYRENLHCFFEELKVTVPEETLVIWNLAMPLGESIRGGFLVPEIHYKTSQLGQDVIEANFYSGTLADAYGMDVLDLHYQFRLSLQHRVNDGVHWNAVAHRRITSLLSQHAAQAWGVILASPLTAVECIPMAARQPVGEIAQRHAELPPTNGHSNNQGELNFRNPVPFGLLPFQNYMQLEPFQHGNAAASRHQFTHGEVIHGFDYRPPQHFEHDNRPHPYVMRSRHVEHHYAPYSRHRDREHGRHGHDRY